MFRSEKRASTGMLLRQLLFVDVKCQGKPAEQANGQGQVVILACLIADDKLIASFWQLDLYGSAPADSVRNGLAIQADARVLVSQNRQVQLARLAGEGVGQLVASCLGIYR